MPPVVTMNPYFAPALVQTGPASYAHPHHPQPTFVQMAPSMFSMGPGHFAPYHPQQPTYFIASSPADGVMMQQFAPTFMVDQQQQQQQQQHHGGFFAMAPAQPGMMNLYQVPSAPSAATTTATTMAPSQPFALGLAGDNPFSTDASTGGRSWLQLTPDSKQQQQQVRSTDSASSASNDAAAGVRPMPYVMQIPEPLHSSLPIATPRGPAHARALGGSCLWIPLTDEPRQVQRTGNPRHCEKLFIGQARHETTPAHIVWMLEALAGVIPVVLRSAGKGCFILFVSSIQECQMVTSLHRRVLFDHQGVWFAANDTGLAALSEYVQSPSFHRACRRQLPVQCMVAEYQPDSDSWKRSSAAPTMESLHSVSTPFPSPALSTSTEPAANVPLADE